MSLIILQITFNYSSACACACVCVSDFWLVHEYRFSQKGKVIVRSQDLKM